MILNEVYTRGNKTIKLENYLQDDGVIHGMMMHFSGDAESCKYYKNKFDKMRKKGQDAFAVRQYLLDHDWVLRIETDQPDIAARWTEMGVQVIFLSNSREDAQKLIDSLDEDSYTIFRGAEQLKQYH